MSLKDILQYAIIKTDEFSLTVYDLLIVFLILAITKSILWLFKRIFNRQTITKRIEKGNIHAIFQIIKYIIWIAAILIILDTIGVRITLLLAGSAALLVGLGLGLQQIFQDILSGIPQKHCHFPRFAL